MSNELGAIRALLSTGLGLAQKTSSGRMALARVAAVADPELLPAEIRADAATELASWRQVPDAMKPGDVEKQLRVAWREKPSNVLDDLDTEPVAVTVSSQVHRGRRDGADVAVKLLRPGLVELVRADLKVAETLAGPLRGALPRSDPGALIREVSARVLDEFDLEHEGATQRALARALRGVDGIVVPAVDSELTHHSVLVRAWAHGTTLADGATVADPARVARVFVHALATAARAGTVHADPEPANVVVGEDGTLALIDAGASARIAAARVDGAAVALAAFLDGDVQRLGAALGALGWLPDPADAEPLHDLGRDLAAPLLAGEARLDRAAAGDRADAGWARIADIAPLAAQISVPPADLWALRGIAAAGVTLTHLGATHDWPALILDALCA